MRWIDAIATGENGGFESVAGGKGGLGYEMGSTCMEGRKTYERLWLRVGSNGSRVSNTPSGPGIVKAETRHDDSSDSVRGKGEAENILSVARMGNRIQLTGRALPDPFVKTEKDGFSPAFRSTAGLLCSLRCLTPYPMAQ